jgi:hypothetical protein
MKWGQVELEAEELVYDGLDLLVQRLDAYAAFGPRDPDLASVDDPVQTTVVPDVCTIDAPEREPVERALEVVRLRYRDKTHRRRLTRGKIRRWRH